MQRRHRIAHRRIWSVLLIVLPLALLGAVALRQYHAAGPIAVPLSPPSFAQPGR